MWAQFIPRSLVTFVQEVYLAPQGAAPPPRGFRLKYEYLEQIAERPLGRWVGFHWGSGAISLFSVWLGLWVSVLASPVDAEGQVYRFTDRRGVVHLTNVPPDRKYEVFVTRRRGIQLGAMPHKRGARLSRGSNYDAIILRASKDHALEPALVKAGIAAESNFDPLAISHQGAQGLMQLMPATARELGVEDAFAPEENVQGGARYLRQMLNRFGDVRRALAAYNAGPTAVDRYSGVPPFPETEAYVDRVLTYYLGFGRTGGP